jgi:hypothetical protein
VAQYLWLIFGLPERSISLPAFSETQSSRVELRKDSTKEISRRHGAGGQKPALPPALVNTTKPIPPGGGRIVGDKINECENDR